MKMMEMKREARGKEWILGLGRMKNGFEAIDMDFD